MGFSSAACAISGLPIDGEAVGLLVARRPGAGWEPFSTPTTVGLDDTQQFIHFEDEKVLLLLAAVLPGDAPLARLRDDRVGEVPMRLPTMELAFALIEPSIAAAATRDAGPQLPRQARALLPLAFPRAAGQLAHANAPVDTLRFCAAVRLLSLELDPFKSFGDVAPGRDFEDVAPAFERAAAQLGRRASLAAAVEALRLFWETGDAAEREAEPETSEDEDEGPDTVEALTFTRTFTGVWTMTVARSEAAPLAHALEALTPWRRLEFVAATDPDGLSAMLKDLGPKHRLTLTDGARATLVAALRAQREWVSDEGEVVVRVG